MNEKLKRQLVWLESDPAGMIWALRDTSNCRKLWLFASACLQCEEVWLNRRRLTEAGVKNQAEVLKAAADGYASSEDLVAYATELGFGLCFPNSLILRRDDPAYNASAVGCDISALVRYVSRRHPSRYEAFRHKLANFLRDIFGNPFSTATFSPEWQTDTAVSLARQMYESREFSAMPILADALQDAGCDSDEILAHCRDATATHVRGCWVVDLVLGKQ